MLAVEVLLFLPALIAPGIIRISTPVPPQAGDTNCDWIADIDDLFVVIAAWGPADPPGPFTGSADLDGDGDVDIDDLFIVIANWS